MELKQYEYYFSNLTYPRIDKFNGLDKSKYFKPIETKVYSLIVGRPDDDVMIIEISSCYGLYNLNIQEELITKDNKGKGNVEFTQTYIKGKNTIIIENLKSKHYYLRIRPMGTLLFCQIDGIGRENCANDLVYLIYYYTTNSNNLQYRDQNKILTHGPYHRGKVKLNLPIIITKDIESNKKEIRDYRFDILCSPFHACNLRAFFRIRKKRRYRQR